MKKFKEWMEIREMMGSVGALVSCKDLKNKSFQVQGALSDRKCARKSRMLKMKFNGDK